MPCVEGTDHAHSAHAKSAGQRQLLVGAQPQTQAKRASSPVRCSRNSPPHSDDVDDSSPLLLDRQTSQVSVRGLLNHHSKADNANIIDDRARHRNARQALAFRLQQANEWGEQRQREEQAEADADAAAHVARLEAQANNATTDCALIQNACRHEVQHPLNCGPVVIVALGMVIVMYLLRHKGASEQATAARQYDVCDYIDVGRWEETCVRQSSGWAITSAEGMAIAYRNITRCVAALASREGLCQVQLP